MTLVPRTRASLAALALVLAGAARAQPSPQPPVAFLPAFGKTVTTSATLLAANPRHTLVMVWNASPSLTLFVSFDPAVTIATGIPIAPGSWLQFNSLGPGQLLYGIAPSASIDARCQEGFDR